MFCIEKKKLCIKELVLAVSMGTDVSCSNWVIVSNFSVKFNFLLPAGFLP